VERVTETYGRLCMILIIFINSTLNRDLISYMIYSDLPEIYYLFVLKELIYSLVIEIKCSSKSTVCFFLIPKIVSNRFLSRDKFTNIYIFLMIS